MARRYRRDWIEPRGQVVDLEQARAAVLKVASERDALAEQLTRAHRAIASLQRQLEARKAETAHLIEALRAVDDQPSVDVDRVGQELEHARDDLRRVSRRCQQAEARVAELELAREEALADRDRERAARKEVEAARSIDVPEGDRAQRLAADLANLRRHQQDAIEAGVRQASARWLREISSVRDSVQRALDTAPDAVGPWHDGLLAIRSRVDGVLQSEGVTVLGAVGEPFDPNLHEAVATSETGQPGTVVQVVSSGMMDLEGRVVEPARVIVGS